MSRTMGRIVNKAVALFTNVRDRQRGRPLRQRDNNLLINVLDAEATSPCENSSPLLMNSTRRTRLAPRRSSARSRCRTLPRGDFSRRRCMRRLVASVCLLLIAAVIGGLPVYVRPQMDRLRHADAILILGGEGESRYLVGLDLGLKGWAPNLVVSNPPGAKGVCGGTFVPPRPPG